jgi:uncharacterized protein (TIGR02678 family)
MADDPQVTIERRVAARHLLQHPLTCAELHVDEFRLIRRHEGELDRWFTQRLGYRLHVDTDTARLFKSGTLPALRPLRTTTERAFTRQEYVLAALVLAATVAGPAVISLRDLVDDVRSAAAEADVALSDDATGRRAVVNVLRWMIELGLATELHAHVEAYASDGDADAVIKLRPDRIALVPLPTAIGVDDAASLLAAAERRSATRQWLRGRLVEDPAVYRDDLTEAEWGELRRRLGEEERLLGEMFGLRLESRAEGVAAIDPDGHLADKAFPAGGTVGHCALLVLEHVGSDGQSVRRADLVGLVAELAERYRRRWSNELVAAPERLMRNVVDLLAGMRLAVIDGDEVRLLPAAARFLAVDQVDTEPGPQGELW